MKAEQFREITSTGRFLLNELGDPRCLMHKFKWHKVEYNISPFLFKCRKGHVFRYSRVCTHAANSLIFSKNSIQCKINVYFVELLQYFNTNNDFLKHI